MTPTVTRSLAPTRLNGNNVAIDEEIVGLTETALRHQLVVEAMNGKFRLLRTAILVAFPGIVVFVLRF